MSTEPTHRILVQICSYNSNMQGEALAQDMVDWLAPTLDAAHYSTKRKDIVPDVVVVGFQELLPLHLGFSGQSKGVIRSRDNLIKRSIEKHHNAKYSLVGESTNVGVAILVYAKVTPNEGETLGLASRIKEVEAAYSACGPAFMGNKGAVAIRFRVVPAPGDTEAAEEIYTFVNSHLTAHAQHYKKRILNYKHIVRTLLFKPVSAKTSATWSTMYETTHLFWFGDLNFRLYHEKKEKQKKKKGPPVTSPKYAVLTKEAFPSKEKVHELNTTYEGRQELARWDQLTRCWELGRAFVGFREGDYTQFPCSYKYVVGTVGDYSKKRVPSWTDRVLYTTAADSPGTPAESTIDNLLYTTAMSFTKSDHKPLTALLLLPASKDQPIKTLNSGKKKIPVLRLPATELKLGPKPLNRTVMRVVGKSLDWIVGWIWCLLWLIGAGHAGVGVGNFVLGTGLATLYQKGKLWVDDMTVFYS